MRMAFHPCRDCGCPDVVITARVDKDIHGCELRYAEWSRCDYCEMIAVVTPWTIMGECEVVTSGA